MASDRFEWSPTARRFRDTTTGRFLSLTTTRRLRDDFADSQERWATILADSLVDGSMTIQAWEREVRTRLRKLYVGEYMLGRGGRGVMTAQDRGRLGGMLSSQYRHLRRFAEDVAAGRHERAGIVARSTLYFASSVQAFERGMTAAYSQKLKLPAYPGDGSTSCFGNCRCSWRLVEKADRWECSWMVRATESCEDCERRGKEWRPLVFEKDV